MGTLTATVAEGKWHVAATAKLKDGEYTAVATEPSAIGNPEGESKAWQQFVIYTVPPALKCNAPASKSDETTPSFSGSSNESGTVVVALSDAETGEEIETLMGHVSGATWSTGRVSPALFHGVYKEVATQASSIGNGPASCETKFEIVEVPTVTLNEVPSPSKNTTPSFSGTTDEKAPVKVIVYEGLTPEGGRTVATIETSVTESGCSLSKMCKWTTGAISALEAGDHVFTAVAVQVSAITGREGISNPSTFEVDTAAPNVVITHLSPQIAVTPGAEIKTNDNTPAFSGTASDPKEEVTVQVFKGPEAKGEEVAKGKTKVSGGNWSVAPLGTALKDGKYTAIASQPSSLKNPTGASAPVTFTVNTAPPKVSLEQIPTPTSDAAPVFSGSATDPKEKVIVHVYAGHGSDRRSGRLCGRGSLRGKMGHDADCPGTRGRRIHGSR